MNWYIEVLKNYAVFSGRARRREYWFFILFNIIISIILYFVDYSTGSLGMIPGFGLLGSIYSLAVFIPGLAVSVRRLHDTNKSGWWILIAFIPILGALVLLVFFFQDGSARDNRYGPNPQVGITY